MFISQIKIRQIISDHTLKDSENTSFRFGVNNSPAQDLCDIIVRNH